MAEMETAAIPSADGDAGKLGLSQPAGGATKRPKRHAKAQWLLKKPNARLAHNPEVPFLVLYSRNMKSDACDNRRDTNTTQVSTVWGGGRARKRPSAAHDGAPVGHEGKRSRALWHRADGPRGALLSEAGQTERQHEMPLIRGL